MDKRHRYKKEDVICGCILIAPLLLGMLVFYIYPIFSTFYYSFTEWGMFGGSTFVGLKNYAKLPSDPYLLSAIKNTLTYTFFMVPCSMVLSILFATMLNQKIRCKNIFRVIYFLPAVTMVTAAAMIWRWIFNSEYGILNSFLTGLGLTESINWLSDPKYVMVTLIVVGVWLSLGRSIILYLAGLQGIPGVLYEAAEIDGAGSFKQFFHITIPLLTPTMFFHLTTSAIGALQLYDTIFIIFSPAYTNPALKNVISLAYLFFREGFTMNNKGYAACIAVVLFGISLAITALNFSFQKKWVNYE